MKVEKGLPETFRMKPSVVKLLNQLGKIHNRKRANMLEVLIMEAAKKEKLK